MPNEISLPQLESNYNESCLHTPDCFVWQSKDGPIPVCKMADSHLSNALRIVKEWLYHAEDGDSIYYDLRPGWVPPDLYEAQEALETELEHRRPSRSL